MRRSKISIEPELLVLLGSHYASLLVLPHSPLKEVGLALQRNHLHPIKGVLAVPDLSRSQSHQKSVRHALYVLGHQLTKTRATLEFMPIRSLGRL